MKTPYIFEDGIGDEPKDLKEILESETPALFKIFNDQNITPVNWWRNPELSLLPELETLKDKHKLKDRITDW